jgi:outer membrane protein OmpA-like peptidoglycan-associated protein
VTAAAARRRLPAPGQKEAAMVKSKVLSDAGWKDVAGKSKVKDNGLLKALEKLKRLGDDDHDETTKVLDEVGKLAGLLQKDKAVAAIPVVAKYVAEVIGEAQAMARDVAKAKAEHEKAQKAEAEAEKKAAVKTAEHHDDDDELTPELLTTKLKPLLKLVAKGETMHTLVAKSGKKVVVMMSRKPISPARRQMLADELGGGSTKYYPGICRLEAGAMTFALKNEVAGMAKLVKVALLEQTGLRLNKLKCRGDDGEDADEDADGAPDDRSGDGADRHGDAAGGASAPGAAGASAAAASSTCVTPEATATDCFFDHDKADLTPSDKTFLGAYAKAYLAGNVTEKIVLEGWASMDGDKDWNKTLSLKRAAQVAAFLVGQKVPRAQVTFDGKGRTADFAPDNPCLNRRVTLRPKLDLKVRDFVDVTQEEPRNVPTGKKPTNTLGEPAPTSNDFDLPTPPDTVSRELVRKELADWLRELGKSQGVKSRDYDVLSTSRVYVAEETLLGRPLGEDLELPSRTPANGDERGYTAKDLADRIANNLPERIPRKNFTNFVKMRAKEVKKQKSIAGQIGDAFDEKADDILADFGVPQKYWKDIKDFAKKRIPDAIDKLPIDDDLKGPAKKAYEKILEEGKGK